MTEVLTQGEVEGPGPGRLVGFVAVAVLLGVVAVAIWRSDDAPAARPSPSASPPFVPSSSGPDPFADFVTVPTPAEVTGIVLPDGEPAFVVPSQGVPEAFLAWIGPDHAREIVGWCAPLETFQDADGENVFDTTGASLVGGDTLTRLPVRGSDDAGTRVDVGTLRESPDPRIAEEPPGTTRCPVSLSYPELEEMPDVHATAGGYAVVRGQYVVSTETRAFCPPESTNGCGTRGWEDWGHGLPATDLAGSYTWSGPFLVHADPETGRLHVIRMPGARLVRRTAVGDGAVSIPVESSELTGDSVRLTTPEGETYTVGPKAAVFIGHGVTGLGLPRGTPEMLHLYLATRARRFTQVALVLNREGGVIRAVVEPPDL